MDVWDTLKKDVLQIMVFGVVFLFPWVFLFALPPLQMGIWLNTEGVAFAIATLGSLASFLLIAIRIRYNPSSKELRNTKASKGSAAFPSLSSFPPLLWGIGGLAILSLLTLLTIPNPRLSWFGHPELLIGAWLWLALSSIILCHVWIKQQENGRLYSKFIRASAGLACLFQILLVLFAHPNYAADASGEWVLYHFTSHLGWVGICLLFLSHRMSGILWNVIRILGIFAMIISHNKIAITGLILGGLIFYGTVSYTPLKKQWGTFLSILLLSPFVLLLAEYKAWTLDIFPTLASRFESMRVLGKDFFEYPLLQIVTGMGWGQMSDSILRQLPSLLPSSLELGKGFWEGIDRFDGSSLNQTADAIAAVGLMGGIFSLFIPLAPFLTSKAYFEAENRTGLQEQVDKGLFFTASLMGMLVYHGWFMMMSVFPIFIVAVIELEGQKKRAVKESVLLPFSKAYFSYWKKAAFMIGGCLSGLTLVWTSFILYSTAVFYGSDLKNSLPIQMALRMGADASLTCENFVRYQGPGAISLAFWIKHYQQKKDQQGYQGDNLIEEGLKCAVQKISSNYSPPSLTLLTSRLEVPRLMNDKILTNTR